MGSNEVGGDISKDDIFERYLSRWAGYRNAGRGNSVSKTMETRNSKAHEKRVLSPLAGT